MATTAAEVKQWFLDKGADIGFETNESPDVRAQRLADLINSGAKSSDQVKWSIDGIVERGGTIDTGQGGSAASAETAAAIAASRGGDASAVTAATIKQRFIDKGADIEFGKTGDETADERAQRIADQINSGARAWDQVMWSIDLIVERGGTIAGGPGGNGEPADASPSAPPEGAVTDEVPGIKPGGVLTKIIRAEQDDLWAMTYTVNGIQHVYTWGSYDDMVATLGADAITSGKYGYLELSEDTLNDGDTWLIGDASALSGQSGSYASWWDDIMREAALEAGVRQPGLLGRFMSDPAVQRIIAMAQAGDWSDARELAELRNTDFYQQDLYPGIDKIMAHNATDPEGEWIRYMNSVTPYLGQLGYETGDDGSYRNLMGELLEKEIRADEFATFTSTFIRAENSPEYAATLDLWLQRDTGRSLTFDDWFDVLAGTSDAELDSIVEKAGLQFQAERTSLVLGADQIARIASLTNMAEEQVAYAFTGAEQKLLALGDQGLARYGLSEKELISAAFGIESEGGKGAAEIGRLATKTITELNLQDDKKAQFYTTFDQRKRPVREGLLASTPELG